MMSSEHIVELSKHPTRSPFIQNMLQTFEPIALSGLGVLIVGEVGTEKELLARTIHQLSGRKDRKFYKLDCHLVSSEYIEKMLFGSEDITLTGIEVQAGIYEEIQSGTLFINHISELTPALQTKILFIQGNQHFHRMGGISEISANVRIIGAIDKKKDFIEGKPIHNIGLHHRICPITINLPPLREKREDIQYFIEEAIRKNNFRHNKHVRGITKDIIKLCKLYHWPGNVKELKDVFEYAVMVSKDAIIRMSNLPDYFIDEFEAHKGLYQTDGLSRNEIFR